MKLNEIYAFLNELSPFEKQASWDNSGLLLGNLQDEIDTIYLSLDVDENLIQNAEENSLFITHHPLIFKPLRDLSGMAYPKNLLKEMIKKNIALISLHTNYDLGHLNAYFVKEVLGFESFYQEEYLIYVKLDLSFNELCERVKERLGLSQLKVSFSGKEKLEKIAICTGSGGDLISSVKADCFLSGDFKYHQAFEALSNNLSLIELGHYESERYFSENLAKYLQNLPLKVIMSVSKNPFQYF